MKTDPWLLFGWQSQYAGKEETLSKPQKEILDAGKAFLKVVDERLDEGIYREHVLIRIREAYLMAIEGLNKGRELDMASAMGDFMYGLVVATGDEAGWQATRLYMSLEDFKDLVEAKPEDLDPAVLKKKVDVGFKTVYGSPFHSFEVQVWANIRPGWYRLEGPKGETLDIQRDSPMRAKRLEDKG